MPKQDEQTGYYVQNKNATKPGRGVSRREMEKNKVENFQRQQQYNKDFNVTIGELENLGLDKYGMTIYKHAPRTLSNDLYGIDLNKNNPKDIDTPQPQLSPVKRAAKAAERQRMKTPGMGNVKAAERRETKSQTVGSMLRGQMMKQQVKK